MVIAAVLCLCLAALVGGTGLWTLTRRPPVDLTGQVLRLVAPTQIAAAIMLAAGFSLNTLTLLAFVLAIGLVVDDAIVMLENISRYIEQGLSPKQAALKGSKEIGFAVVAMTLT